MNLLIFSGKVFEYRANRWSKSDRQIRFCSVEFKLFSFSPKLTTLFDRSRLGEVPPLRPLVYLLDGI